jgi:ubiquinone/menaquinone biosynthesis C-methylase UbiE
MGIDYTDISKTYDDYRSYPEELMRQTVDLGGIQSGMRLLDLGCGTGNVGVNLKQKIGVRVIGVDVSIPMLQIANSKSLPVVCADAEKDPLPFGDCSFDAIVAVYVIHQIRDLAFLFGECLRVLGSGTLTLLTSGHAQLEHQHPIIKEAFPSFVGIEKARFPDIPEVERLLNSAGFSDVRSREVRVAGLPLDESFLQKVENKYISTYHLMPEKEYEIGVEKLRAFVKNRSKPRFREWRATLVCGSKPG